MTKKPKTDFEYFLFELSRVFLLGQQDIEQLSHSRLKHQQIDLIFLARRIHQRDDEVQQLTHLPADHTSTRLNNMCV